MMTQSVMTQAANLFGSSAGSVTLKGKQSESDFSIFMGDSLKTSQDSMVHTDASTTKKSTVQTNDKQKSIKSDESATTDTKKDSVKTDSLSKSDSISEKTVGTKSDKAKVSKDEDAVTNPKDEIKDDDQTIVQIQGMLQSIQQAIMDKLNLSPEEFNKLLSDQGMSLEDLIQPENLQQLILANSGETNVLAALTDENLAASMNQLLQTVSDLKAESNLGLTDDQIKSILKQAEALANAQTETLADTSGVADQVATQNELANQSETVATANTAEESKNKVTVKSTTETIVQTDASKTVATEQTNTGSQTSSNSDSNKDLNASDHFQTFVDNLVNASQNIQSDFAGEMTQVTNIREIANQIVERIKVSIMPGQTSMELQLNPENLGKVNLTVQSKDGIMTAHFVVQNEISKEAIESQIQTLRDTLLNQGVKVEAIEVTVSSNAFEQSNFNNPNNEEESKKSNSGKQISLEDALAMTEVSDENSSTEDATGVRGSVVDYTA